MSRPTNAWRKVTAQPGHFTLRVLKAFQKNQGLLLSGALAIGGIAVGLLWEATRHILVWYFSTLSVVGVLYGSLATTIVGLLSLEIASIILLLGAQVIAEYERLQDGDTAALGELKTDPARVEVR